MHVAEPRSEAQPFAVLHQARNRGQRPMAAEDLWRMSRVGAPAPAPDGSFLIVPVTTYDIEENRGRARLWRIPRQGEARPLTSADA